MMRKDPVFIYSPRGTDRVFAEEPSPALVVVRWPNWSRHVIGGYHVSWDAAPKWSWHRRDAKRLLAQIVRLHGGIAWDEYGRVHTVLPLEGVHLLYTVVADLIPEASTAVKVALWRAGVSLLVRDADGAPAYVFEWSFLHAPPGPGGWGAYPGQEEECETNWRYGDVAGTPGHVLLGPHGAEPDCGRSDLWAPFQIIDGAGPDEGLQVAVYTRPPEHCAPQLMGVCRYRAERPARIDWCPGGTSTAATYAYVAAPEES